MAEFSVELKGVRKQYGQVVAVEAMDLSVREGEFLSFLGPSGCGKTTTLRMIAGLETPTAGDILVRGKRMNDIPIHRRNIGLVFQNYALFPHRTVYQNIAFGLRYRKCPKAEIERRVADVLSLVQLDAMAQRYPAELSGGQQQRVALARAIVIRPDLLLLDEPLSALDANLRESMRIELKQIQRETGITTLFITHDQSEALAMSDRIAVMSQGRVQQLDAPQTVYNRPATEFCARFLGNANLMPGTVVQGEPGAWQVHCLGQTWHSTSDRIWEAGASVTVVLRAEHFNVAEPDASLNTISLTIDHVDYLGTSAHYLAHTDNGEQLELFGSVGRTPLTAGTRLSVTINPEHVVLLEDGADSPDAATPGQPSP